MIKLIERRLVIETTFILTIGLFGEVHLFITTEKGGFPVLLAALLVIQLAAAVIDLHSRIIPLWLVLSSLPLGALIFVIDSSTISEHVFGGTVAFLVMALLKVVSKGQIGGGDLQLFALTGFFSGIDLMPGILILSFVLAGLFSGFLLVLRKSSIKAEIPFAPFILLATAVITL